VTRTVQFRAPARIDFGGGWTDVPPYATEAGGFVCNVAITRYASVRVSPLPDGAGAPQVVVERPSDRGLAVAALDRLGVDGVEVELRSDFPTGAGLGGSSAAGVALVTALRTLQGLAHDAAVVAEMSREIETADLGIAGGRQDHYAAACGGALGLRFGAGVTVERIPLSPATRAALATRCLVTYTGQSRISGGTISSVMDAWRSGDARVAFALRRSRELAEAMPAALASGDIDALAGLVGEQWAHQRALHPAIPTPRIDEIIARARDAGAIGGKALGASGGGCVLVIARADRVEEVRAAIAPLGQLLDFDIDQQGVHAWP
jgi:D-glycero-alpha-D-manno-heptose-7-phosphate kinase